MRITTTEILDDLHTTTNRGFVMARYGGSMKNRKPKKRKRGSSSGGKHKTQKVPKPFMSGKVEWRMRWS